MNSKLLKRITNDMESIHESKLDGIFVQFDEQDITKAKAMIIGLEDTPYEYGFFFFDINFPSNYPHSPPKVLFRTQDPARKVRFHPNLYTEGKVCLSILGTYSGPEWSPAMKISTVLLTIRSLLTEMPLRHEPSFENITDNNRKTHENYSEYITHENIRWAIIHQLNFFPKEFEMFKDDAQEHFSKIKDDLIKKCVKYSDRNGKKFDSWYQSGGSSIVAQYEKLVEEIKKIN